MSGRVVAAALGAAVAAACGLAPTGSGGGHAIVPPPFARVALDCDVGSTGTVTPRSRWIPAEASASLYIQLSVTAEGEPPQGCAYELVNPDRLRAVQILETRLIPATGVELEVVPSDTGLDHLAFALNGRTVDIVSLMVTSQAFADAAIGHKGAGAAWPENTLLAIRAAAAAGLLASEVDVRLTRDTVPILMHDPTLNRTTLGFGAVESFTADYVTTLDAGARAGDRFRGERVPTLAAAVAAAVEAGHPLLLDVKADQGVLSASQEATLIVDVVRAAGGEALVTILSPSPDFLRSARARSSAVGLALLSRQGYYGWHLQLSRELRTAMIVYDPDSLMLERTMDAAPALAANGTRLVAATVNGLAHADALLATGAVYGILTDVPPRMYNIDPGTTNPVSVAPTRDAHGSTTTQR